MDCALAKAASESRAKDRIPTMVTNGPLRRKHGIIEWLSTGKNQEIAQLDTLARWFELEMVRIWLNQASKIVCQREISARRLLGDGNDSAGNARCSNGRNECRLQKSVVVWWLNVSRSRDERTMAGLRIEREDEGVENPTNTQKEKRMSWVAVVV